MKKSYEKQIENINSALLKSSHYVLFYKTYEGDPLSPPEREAAQWEHTP